MITLSLLKLLENNRFGKIDKSLFWGKMGLDDYGVYISELGDAGVRGQRRSIQYQLYSRGKDDVKGYKQLECVVDFLNKQYGLCTLPSVRKPNGETLSKAYDNVTIMPLSTITNAGQDLNGHTIYTATGRIYY